MRTRTRFRCFGSAVVAFALVGVLATPASAGQRVQRAPARVKTIGCGESADAVTFEGRMRRLRRSKRMAMRFSLWERLDDGSYKRIEAPGLGKLRRSRRGVRRFVFGQRVEGLEAGHAYRATVRFAWYDRRGRRIRRAKRRSHVCQETGELPNLRVTRIRQRRGLLSRTARYSVRVANDGPVAAGKIPVLLTVDGAVLDTRQIPRLEPGASDVVEFMGPACRRTVLAEADPLDAIREQSGADNRLFRPCPL